MHGAASSLDVAFSHQIMHDSTLTWQTDSQCTSHTHVTEITYCGGALSTGAEQPFRSEPLTASDLVPGRFHVCCVQHLLRCNPAQIRLLIAHAWSCCCKAASAFAAAAARAAAACRNLLLLHVVRLLGSNALHLFKARLGPAAAEQHSICVTTCDTFFFSGASGASPCSLTTCFGG
jgi:hypothetical protein